MTVYVVWRVDNYGMDVAGVFSTRDKAERYASVNGKVVEIEEFGVDAKDDDTVEIVTLTEAR